VGGGDFRNRTVAAKHQGETGLEKKKEDFRAEGRRENGKCYESGRMREGKPAGQKRLTESLGKKIQRRTGEKKSLSA